MLPFDPSGEDNFFIRDLKKLLEVADSEITKINKLFAITISDSIVSNPPPKTVAPSTSGNTSDNSQCY